LKKKIEKLILISLSGEEYEIGFLSPCTDGVVLGTSQQKEGESAHLTILNKEGTISAHITPQKKMKEKQYFPPSSVEDFTTRLQLLLENNMIFQLSPEQMSEDVFFLTRKFEYWYNALVKALFQKKTTKKEIIHIVNIKNFLEKIPLFVNEIKNEPHSFFGLCKAKDMLNNDSIIIGISNSKKLIIPYNKELIGIDLRVFINFDFTPSMDKSQLSIPLTEFYQSLGITQYIQQEVVGKRFLENLLSKENWQEAGAELSKKLDKGNTTDFSQTN
jgi:hypothetical protein